MTEHYSDKFPASFLIHYPNGPVFACELHKNSLVLLHHTKADGSQIMIQAVDYGLGHCPQCLFESEKAVPVYETPRIEVAEIIGGYWRVILSGPDLLQNQDDRLRCFNADIGRGRTREEALAAAATWFLKEMGK